MSIQTNSQNTFAAIGQREDLTDIVALIDPQETPFISNIKTAPPAKAVKHEWQTQALAAPSKTNFQLEGDDAVSAGAATARVRLSNYAAISNKIGSVTGTMGAVEVAGVANELDNQKILKAKELRRDMEVILLDNNAYVPGGTATARECAGLAAYITKTDTTGWSVGSYSAAAGTGADAWVLTNSSARALSLTLLNGALLSTHTAGGKPNMAMMPPAIKVSFTNLTLSSTLGGGSQVRYNTDTVKPMALIGAVDTWLSNFGELQVVSNVQMSTDASYLNKTVYLIDTNMAGVSYLRGFQTFPLAKTGDADKFEVLAEYTLQVDAPNGHAALFNMY